MLKIATRPPHVRCIAAAVVLGVSLTSFSGTALGDCTTVACIEQLLAEGQVIEARQALLTMQRTGSDAEDIAAVAALMRRVEQDLRTMSADAISLQKAEYAFRTDDLTEAQRHANAVRRSDNASVEQRLRASNLLDEVARRRDELAPMVAPMLEQVVTDYLNDRYAEAKSGLMAISRLGLRLSQEQQAVVNKYRTRIFDLERQRGEAFEIEYVSTGVVQAATAGVTAAATAQDGGDDAVEELLDEIEDKPEETRVRELDPDDDLEEFTEAQPTDEEPWEEPAQEQWQDSPQEQWQDPAPAEVQQSADDLFDQAARVDAERLLREAALAMDAGRYNEAIDKYQRALNTYPQFLTADQKAMAEDRILEAEQRIGATSGNLASQVASERETRRQQAIAEYDNLVEQSRAAMAAGETSQAAAKAGQARLTIGNAREVLSEEEFNRRNTEINNLLREIDQVEEQLRVAAAQRRADQLRKEQSAAEAELEAEKARKVNESLLRLRALQSELKYEEAIAVAEEILFIDPNNPAALLMKDVLTDIVLYRKYDKLQREKALSYTKASIAIQEGMILTDDVVEFPPDWPELSLRRGEVQSFVESEADRAVLAKVTSTRVPATFQDNSLSDVLTFVATVTNLNMDVDWESLADIGIDQEEPVTMELRDVPVNVLLDRVLEKVSPDEFSRASWAVQDGIIVVASDEALRKNTFIVIYDVRDMLFEVPNFDNMPDLDLDSVLQQAQSGGGGGGGGGSIFEDEDEDALPEDREEELLEQLLDIIQTNVDFDGWRDNGGDTGIVQTLNGNLIITNTARNHRQIQGLLTQLREIRSLQISVETRFLQVGQDFFEQIGFDIDVIFNANNNQVKAAQQQQTAFSGVNTPPFNQGYSLLPSDLIGQRTGSTTDYNFDATGQAQFTATNYSVVQPDPLSIVPVQQGSDAIVDTLIRGAGFASEVLTVGSALSVAGVFLDEVQVDFLVEATQADRRNVVLNAPRLTFTNGRTANIYVARQVAFISDLQPVVGTSAVAFDPTISPASEGFTLLVRGVVSADRRYVTLWTVATLAVLDEPFPSAPVVAIAGAGGDGGGNPVTAESEIQLPTATVTRVSTGVTIPDKGTVMLGGQRLTSELEVESGVPVLNKLPILNRFFSNTSISTEESTLLILMKPTILIQNEQEEENFPGLLDSLENPYGY